MTKKINKPGQTADISGQYQIVDNKGRISGLEITMVEGKRFPPTDKPNQGYILVDKTKHKN